jgi:hypothetical protein
MSMPPYIRNYRTAAVDGDAIEVGKMTVGHMSQHDTARAAGTADAAADAEAGTDPQAPDPDSPLSWGPRPVHIPTARSVDIKVS